VKHKTSIKCGSVDFSARFSFGAAEPAPVPNSGLILSTRYAIDLIAGRQKCLRRLIKNLVHHRCSRPSDGQIRHGTQTAPGSCYRRILEL